MTTKSRAKKGKLHVARPKRGCTCRGCELARWRIAQAIVLGELAARGRDWSVMRQLGLGAALAGRRGYQGPDALEQLGHEGRIQRERDRGPFDRDYGGDRGNQRKRGRV